MIRFWTWVQVVPPRAADPTPTSEWTKDGREYMTACKDQGVSPKWIAGVHYVALKGKDRIRLPELPCLYGLRHRWFWERRGRPLVPS